MIIHDCTITCIHIDAIDLGFTSHHVVWIPGTSARLHYYKSWIPCKSQES